VSAAGEPTVVTPIGYVRSPRSEAVDDDWGGVVSTITLVAEEFDADSLAGLEEFSHVEVVYLFDRVDAAAGHRNARHPRHNPDWPRVGIFAQRARNRPNRIGITTCRLLAVSGITVTVEGLDAIDGTPVLDIKPYLAEFGPRGEVRQPAWADELMTAYWSTSAVDG
jgi:tRNA-Thr(GGU) m(6)t(6)A37 methyltransferase TsaA